jgi:hypothetical protein
MGGAAPAHQADADFASNSPVVLRKTARQEDAG